MLRTMYRDMFGVLCVLRPYGNAIVDSAVGSLTSTVQVCSPFHMFSYRAGSPDTWRSQRSDQFVGGIISHKTSHEPLELCFLSPPSL